MELLIWIIIAYLVGGIATLKKLEKSTKSTKHGPALYQKHLGDFSPNTVAGVVVTIWPIVFVMWLALKLGGSFGPSTEVNYYEKDELVNELASKFYDLNILAEEAVRRRFDKELGVDEEELTKLVIFDESDKGVELLKQMVQIVEEVADSDLNKNFEEDEV